MVARGNGAEGRRCPGPGQRERHRHRRRLSRAAAAMIPPPPLRCQSSRCARSSAGQRPGAPGVSGGASADGGEARTRAAGRGRLPPLPASPLFLSPSLRLFGRLGEGPCRREAGDAVSKERGSEGRRSGTGWGRAGCRAAAGPGGNLARVPGGGPGGQGPLPGDESDSRVPSPGPREAPLEEVAVPRPRGFCGRHAADRRSRGSPSQISHVGTSPQGRAAQAKWTWSPFPSGPGRRRGNSCKVPRQLWAVAGG